MRNEYPRKQKGNRNSSLQKKNINGQLYDLLKMIHLYLKSNLKSNQTPLALMKPTKHQLKTDHSQCWWKQEWPCTEGRGARRTQFFLERRSAAPGCSCCVRSHMKTQRKNELSHGTQQSNVQLLKEHACAHKALGKCFECVERKKDTKLQGAWI